MMHRGFQSKERRRESRRIVVSLFSLFLSLFVFLFCNQTVIRLGKCSSLIITYVIFDIDDNAVSQHTYLFIFLFCPNYL